MTSANRADRIEQLFKALKKHYKPTTIATDRPVLDLLLYACCLEDGKFESADEAFAKLQQSYFDWNEVRVTTVAELAEVLASLPDPGAAANRIKLCLQSLFESRYSFEIDELRKGNLGKTVAELEAWKGMSKFIVSFVTQNALGGHAIPIDNATMEVMKHIEIVSPAEASKGIVPGLERTIAKSKGPEFSSLLHQFAAEFHANPKSATALAVFKELGVNPKPKPVPPPPAPKTAAPSTSKAAAPVAGKSDSQAKGPAKGTKVPPPKELPTSSVKKVAPAKPVEEMKPAKPAAKIVAKPAEKTEKPAPKSVAGKKPVLQVKPSAKPVPKKDEKKSSDVKKANERLTKESTKSGSKSSSKPSSRKPIADLKKSNVKKGTSGPKKSAAPSSSKPKPKPAPNKITKKKPK